MQAISKSSLIFTLALPCCLLSSSAATGESLYGGETIALIGYTPESGAVSAQLPLAVFQRDLTNSIATVRDSFAPALSRRPQPREQPWQLRTLAVGLFLTGNFRLGPLRHWRGVARIRLVFTNSAHPPYPDL
ncbi:MAG TPA: hypothetical protein VIH99_02470 [Bdellovibrionota bacterium]|jgi:hypothetical protein